MSWLVAPQNDYRSVRPGDPSSLTAALVVPVYNRGELLDRTLTALRAQTFAATVFVADDGSEEDIETIVDRHRAHIDVTYLRQDHDGFGAGRARNMGAAAATSDVLIFIDSDCIPDPNLVARHTAWHAAADNLVVIGSRRHIEGSGFDLSDLAAGTAELAADAHASSVRPRDFRDVLGRRTAGFVTGTEAFRSLVSSNFSLRREMFTGVDGFSADYHRWGGEDTELGWRLQQAGAFFVPDDEAVMFHQTDLDGPSGWRDEERRLRSGMDRSKMPHRFYRRGIRLVIEEVPKVSVVLAPPPEVDLDLVVTDLLDQTMNDLEVIVPADPRSHDPFGSSVGGDPRVRFSSERGGVESAADVARGELLFFLHGATVADRRLLARVVKRLDQRPTISSLTVGYRVFTVEGWSDHTRRDDVADLDAAWKSPVPLAFAIRRRDWSRCRSTGSDIASTWRQIRAWDRPDHLATALVALPGAEAAPRPAGFRATLEDTKLVLRDMRRSGTRGAVPVAARFVGARLRNRPYGAVSLTASSVPKRPAVEPVSVRYVGWTGHDNLGDEAMLEAIRRLMPWARIETRGDPQNLLMLGGGTLINRTMYLDWLRERDSPRLERVTFGTGVANPQFWGAPEDVAGWKDWLDSCAYVGVRGPHSAKTLRSWGYRGDIEVVGDPALALTRPPGTDVVPGRVVVAPVWTRAELWGGDDDAVFDQLARAVGSWRAGGREVVMFSCHPDDDRPILEVMRRSGHPDLPYVAGYLDLEEALRQLAAADVVVAERLHAAILAAAVGTAFVPIEYRPKLADFSASVGVEDLVTRTDHLDAAKLCRLVERTDWTAVREKMSTRVAKHRTSLEAAAAITEAAVRA